MVRFLSAALVLDLGESYALSPCPHLRQRDVASFDKKRDFHETKSNHEFLHLELSAEPGGVMISGFVDFFCKKNVCDCLSYV